MKVTVAVDRTRAAARWSEGRGERRQSAWNLRTGAAARTRLGGSTPWTSRPCKLSPGWTAEKQENGLPAAICNVSICARVCSLLEEDNNKPTPLCVPWPRKLSQAVPPPRTTAQRPTQQSCKRP
ncbi:uncharacterized protein LOC123938779 isoform X11 [Meles meles]|uniref:uncharacterized protein LOC123938779 isoform X11 n=1 Tax=Meles meles TaxID=9662 RepID=UPI001E69CD05|nr:uncharacterized protein LOC123938779 isoform X11 [Meles meles]